MLMSRKPLGFIPMDNYKLQLLRERDEIWAEARESMPLFEKLFAGDDLPLFLVQLL